MTAPLLDLAKLDEMAAIFGEAARDSLMRRLIEELAVRPAEIAAAAASGDRAQTCAAAHYLRGAALSVGAARVALIADAIEHDMDGGDTAALSASAAATRCALTALL